MISWCREDIYHENNIRGGHILHRLPDRRAQMEICVKFHVKRLRTAEGVGAPAVLILLLLSGRYTGKEKEEHHV